MLLTDRQTQVKT